MRRLVSIDGLAVPVILAIALLGTACNTPGNRPAESEAIIHGTAITYSGTSAADTKNPLAVNITFDVIARTQDPVTQSQLNAVQFLSYTISYTSPFVVVSTVQTQGVWYPVGSTSNVLSIVLEATKTAGDVVTGHIAFTGRDDLGRVVNYDVDFGTVVTA